MPNQCVILTITKKFYQTTMILLKPGGIQVF